MHQKNFIKNAIQKIFCECIVWRMGGDSKTLYLTFDDGPHPVYTPLVLEILAQFGIKGTFFLVGKDVIAHPEIVRNIVEQGHQVGNHSFSHGLEWRERIKNYDDEIRRCEEAIFSTIGIRPRIFRPPWGVLDFGLFYYCLIRNIKIVKWSYDSLDCKKENYKGIYEAKSQDILLLHDDGPFAVEILKKDIPCLLNLGYSFDTLTAV